MKIECEAEFCMYYKKGECVLKSIELDDIGHCINMFFVDVDEELLAIKRKKLLSKTALTPANSKSLLT